MLHAGRGETEKQDYPPSKKREDKEKLIEDVRPSFHHSLGGIRALGRAGCQPSSTGSPGNAFSWQIRLPEVSRWPNWFPVILQGLGPVSSPKSHCLSVSTFSELSPGKPAHGERLSFLAPTCSPLATSTNNMYQGSLSLPGENTGVYSSHRFLIRHPCSVCDGAA